MLSLKLEEKKKRYIHRVRGKGGLDLSSAHPL